MLIISSLSLFSFSILSNFASSSPSPKRSTDVSENSSIQHLSLDFTSRSKAGKVSVIVQPNNDNETANGLSLIYGPAVSPPDYYLNFHGFPVIHSTIVYPIPANPTSGYGSLFGWIQFIKYDYQGEAEGDWAVDSFPYATDLMTPFGGWGFNPTMFDAPAILWAPNNTGVVWRAQTYLCELVDAGVSKNVTVLPGAVYTWGYDLNVNAKNASQRSIAVTKLQPLNVSEWNQRLPLLREQYTEWTFYDV
jgi:hypothetical protein